MRWISYRVIMKKFAVLFFAFLASISASAYDHFFVFGDSLSDVGNAPNTRDLNYGGRWSNGSVWCEYLAVKLGLTPAANSANYSAGDTFATNNINFAYGGAMTSFGTTSLTGIPSVNEQIFGKKNALDHVTDLTKGFDRYGLNFSENDLVATWAGANNLFFAVGSDYGALASAAADDMIANLEQLILRGAKNLLILNLPDIGTTPSYVADAEGAANATLFSKTFNDILGEGVALLQASYLDVDFMYINIFDMFNEMINDAAAYGFQYTETSLLDAFGNANPPTDEEAAQYLFYDSVHPTTAGHKLLADLIYAQIPEPSHYAAMFGFAALCVAMIRKKLKCSKTSA